MVPPSGQIVAPPARRRWRRAVTSSGSGPVCRVPRRAGRGTGPGRRSAWSASRPGAPGEGQPPPHLATADTETGQRRDKYK